MLINPSSVYAHPHPPSTSVTVDMISSIHIVVQVVSVAEIRAVYDVEGSLKE